MIVHPLLDLVKEQPETVILSLLAVDCMTNAAPVRPCYTVGPTNKATVQILDSSTNAPPTSNAIPVVVITAPASNKVFSAGSVVEVSAVATDSDGYAAHADLYDGTNHVGVSEITFIRAPDPGTPITHSFRLTNLLSGSHILLATARDDKGLIGYSQKLINDL